MSSIDRPLSGSLLLFDLDDPVSLPQHGRRTARTLVGSGALRVTLVAIEAGGHTAEHQAAGPVTIQALAGQLRFEAQGRSVTLHAGQLLHVEPGLRHRVSSAEGGTFLLTVAQPAGPPDPGAAA